MKFGESFTVTALPFDALFRLAAAARITIVGDEAAVPIDIFLRFIKQTFQIKRSIFLIGRFLFCISSCFGLAAHSCRD